jgi:hypothetical protein
MEERLCSWLKLNMAMKQEKRFGIWTLAVAITWWETKIDSLTLMKVLKIL